MKKVRWIGSLTSLLRNGSFLVVCVIAPVSGTSQTLYSIGQPTDEEQLFLEYINRSRANPPAEGARLTLWSQAGYNGSGESGFTRLTNSLSAYAGAVAQFRFRYEFVSGSYNPSTSSGAGL